MSVYNSKNNYYYIYICVNYYIYINLPLTFGVLSYP